MRRFEISVRHKFLKELGVDKRDIGRKSAHLVAYQLSGGLPGSPILTANGFVAGFLIDALLLQNDLSGATRQHHHYHLMGNFPLDYYKALDAEVGHLIKFSGIRAQLARENPYSFLGEYLEYSAGNPEEMVPLREEGLRKLETDRSLQRTNTATHESFSTMGFLTIFVYIHHH